MEISLSSAALIVKSDNFPQEILDNETYYTDLRLLRLLVQNRRFRNWDKILKSVNNVYILQELMNMLPFEQTLAVYKETGDIRILANILKTSPVTTINDHIAELYVEPTSENFEFVQNDVIARNSFYIVSRMTKSDALKIVCTKTVTNHVYAELSTRFDFNLIDINTIMDCQPDMIFEIAATGKYDTSIFSKRLERLNQHALNLLYNKLEFTLGRYNNMSQTQRRNIIELQSEIQKLL